MVPAGESSHLESLPDNPARALRVEDLLGNGSVVPLGGSLSVKLLEHSLGFLLLIRLGLDAASESGKVIKLLRIALKVKELGLVGRASDVLPGATTNHEQRANSALAGVLGKNGVVALLTLEVGHQAQTIHGKIRCRLGTDKVAKCGEDIKSGDIVGNSLGGEPLGVVDKHGDADGGLEVAHLVPETALAQHVTVVSREDDNGVVSKPSVLESLEQPADAVIDVAARSIVGALSALDLVIGEVLVPEIADLHQTLAVAILLVLGNTDLGQVNVHALVEIPVLLGDGVRVMGVGKRDLARHS